MRGLKYFRAEQCKEKLLNLLTIVALDCKGRLHLSDCLTFEGPAWPRTLPMSKERLEDLENVAPGSVFCTSGPGDAAPQHSVREPRQVSAAHPLILNSGRSFRPRTFLLS